MIQDQQLNEQEKLVVRSFTRASRSVRCLPFKKAFYNEVAQKAMASEELVKRNDWRELVFAPFGESRAEDHFIWLIKLGILRREVDGQGLTKKVRLTPFGEEVIGQWVGEIPRAGIRERIYENFFRHRIRIT
jgi:hypothetical protein